jgi:hypothetical protein
VVERARRKTEMLEAVKEAADEYRAVEERATAEMDEAREKFRAALRAASSPVVPTRSWATFWLYRDKECSQLIAG